MENVLDAVNTETDSFYVTNTSIIIKMVLTKTSSDKVSLISRLQVWEEVV